VPPRTVSVLDGTTFVVGDGLGDLDAAPARLHGFFRDDTRFVSDWRLSLDGAPLDGLTVTQPEYFSAQFFLVPQQGTMWEKPHLSLIRRRVVGAAWVEELYVVNHRDDPTEIQLRIDVDTDFADLFEVKDGEVRERRIERRAGDREIVMSYRRGDFVRETRISADGDWQVDAGGFVLPCALGPRDARRLSFLISPHGEPRSTGRRARAPARSYQTAVAEMRDELTTWTSNAPRIESGWNALDNVYRRALSDLAAVRLHPDVDQGASVPAAGLPWFMALFGRDSLITSYQALPMVPHFARTTLLTLAARQATEVDDFREAEPGKILHEQRHGELTVFGDRPHSPYYGTADATPLFLILLEEYERWTGDAELVRTLEPNARAALAWIDEYGDMDGDGYVEYERRNQETGLANQCWKDSPNSILFADGSPAQPPIACCEIQGYVYDAKRRCARLARELWDDPELAERLEHQAAELRRRFHHDFWIEDGGYYALALDRDKRRVDSLTSNIGHLLWSGILDPEPAAAVAGHLMDGRLFSGWGVRTMATGDAGHNPLEYHNGSVWPHDNSLIAAGLARYGFRAEAGRIAVAQVEAAAAFTDSLPEVFAGYDRALTELPVEYPTASRPQAWASGAPLLLVRSLMGLEPSAEGPRIDPALPERIGRLALRGVPGRWGSADAIAGGRGGRP
jgi:glycogen debranching enzyme